MSYSAETSRAGITLEIAPGDCGVLGTRYRVRQGSRVVLTTRNRGDALRQFQRLVRLVSAAS